MKRPKNKSAQIMTPKASKANMGVPAAMQGGAGGPGGPGGPGAPGGGTPADMQNLLMQMKKKKGVMTSSDPSIMGN